MKDWFKKLKTDPEGDFEDGAALNAQNSQRNKVVMALLVTGLVIGIMAMLFYYRSVRADPNPGSDASPIDFGAVIEEDFTAKDNQSALSAQQLAIDKLTKMVDGLEKNLAQQLQSNQLLEKTLRDRQESWTVEMDAKMAEAKETLAEQLQPAQLPESADVSDDKTVPKGRYLGQTDFTYRQPGYSDLNKDGSYSNRRPIPAVTNTGIDHVALTWTDEETETYKRTTKNYVPSGTVVTAVITGGADANAGVNGQGDTTPVVFQTLNNGLLPNGSPSRLKDCTITAAAYGEVSSSRGIARTNRISCIFDEEEIIDIPVEGTAFNYGRNGIRGNTVIQNGQIVQMAGVASILTGGGAAAKSLTQTTSTSALGTTSSVKPEDALLNMLGEGVEGAGKTLADYYIKLAEQYHPIIELNPGNVVNIVFLKGFPLDAVGIEKYEAELAQQNPISSPAAQMIETITNPLLSQLPNGAKPGSGKQATNIMAASPFGHPQ